MESAKKKPERTFPTLNLTEQTLQTEDNPVLVVQSPKTPTLNRKLKAVSLDSEPKPSGMEMARDVFSMPNTPKKQLKEKTEFDEGQKSSLTPNFSSNLKKFASNNSISGSQTLKTLPEIMTLQDFSDNKTTPFKIKAKGLLERRGSNASLTIDLGSNSNIAEVRAVPLCKLNTAKSVSNLNLSSFGQVEKCNCLRMSCEAHTKGLERRKSQEACGNCIIYEKEPSKYGSCKAKCQGIGRKGCAKSRRKSLSNENLYVPPCGFCQTGAFKDCTGTNKHCKGYRKAFYPRQPDLESSQLLSEDFKLHLQNIQYLQTAGNVLSISDLKQSCELGRVPKLHQEFWQVPLNLQEKCYVSGSQSKNRYRGILPNEHSRVHLPGAQNYIHANYIKGPDYTETAYIATQGPMENTCLDFWEMIWFTNCRSIVMLTNLVEKGRNKCELYFPLGKERDKEKSYLYLKTIKVHDKFTFDLKNAQFEEETVEFEELNEIRYGSFIIKFVSKEKVGDCHLRLLELTRDDNRSEVRKIKHYWYSEWLDHKISNPEQVLQIALHVLNSNKCDISERHNGNELLKGDNRLGLSKRERKKSMELVRNPIVAHCSAGIGRTGCFLAVLNGIQQLKVNRNVDVLAILCSLRLNRGGMVHTAEQYELIHRVLNLYSEKL